MTKMKEQLLSIDDFNNPKVLSGLPVDVIMIIRLILLDPGTIQTHPDMGVGIVSRWRYSFEEDLSNLEDEIQKQIITYLPHLSNTTTNVRYQGKCILIDVLADKTQMIFKTNEEVSEVYLKDILQ